jgi:benzoyl-CoA-dihydrodiol lyase
VLPGTGGLTRITDKRKVRRDLCDVFSTTAEGVKGKRAVEWGFVDGIAPLSRWQESVEMEARALAGAVEARGSKGVALDALAPALEEGEEGSLTRRYRHVTLALRPGGRVAELEITAPGEAPSTAEAAFAEGARWWALRAFRELDDALCQLRLNHGSVALVLLRAKGSADSVLATDALLAAGEHWFVREVRGQIRRTLKRLDQTARTFYAVADEGTCFAGTFLELALAADRLYLLDDPERPVALRASAANGGLFPMGNGLSRLATRFLGTPARVGEVLGTRGEELAPERALELGLATFAPDEIDWEDELRLAIEERVSLSPDALTGMEANLRFAGPETMETKIFGRLSAWQNWIFQRPNAVGERGALTCYGTPNRPEFDSERT